MSKINLGLRRGLQTMMNLVLLMSSLKVVVILKVLRLLVLRVGRSIGKCLVGTSSFFGCGRDGNKVRDFPTIAAIGRQSKKVPPNVPDSCALERNHFYAFRAKGTDLDDDVDKL